jgi:ParB family chromosome partitioning protein
MSKKGLGRGLGELIPETSAFSHKEGEVVLSLPVDSIEPNPQQPRQSLDADELASLADSIREQGLLQPVVVRRIGESRYQLVAGERRWRAAAQAGFERVPAILRETEDWELLPLALVENLVRTDLNPTEEAQAYTALMEAEGLTQEGVADRVARSRVHVANTLRLLKLPAEIRADVATGRLTRGHARALLACENDGEMFALRERILTLSLSVREAEDRVGASAGEEGAPRKRKGRRRDALPRDVSPAVRELEERLQRVYGTPVQIHERKGRGRVALEFFSLEDLERLTELLLAAEAAPSRP